MKHVILFFTLFLFSSPFLNGQDDYYEISYMKKEKSNQQKQDNLFSTTFVANPFQKLSQGLKRVGWKIFPNPASDYSNLLSDESLKGYHVSIFNLHGEAIDQFVIKDKVSKINVSNLSPGMYFIHLKNSNRGEVSVKTLIIQ